MSLALVSAARLPSGAPADFVLFYALRRLHALFPMSVASVSGACLLFFWSPAALLSPAVVCAAEPLLTPFFWSPAAEDDVEEEAASLPPASFLFFLFFLALAGGACACIVGALAHVKSQRNLRMASASSTASYPAVMLPVACVCVQCVCERVSVCGLSYNAHTYTHTHTHMHAYMHACRDIPGERWQCRLSLRVHSRMKRRRDCIDTPVCVCVCV
jgi:hypothetical protein